MFKELNVHVFSEDPQVVDITTDPWQVWQ